MRMKLVRYIALFIVLLGMVGIVAADPDPCPDPSSNEWTDPSLIDPTILVLFENQPGNTVKFKVQGPSSTVVNGIPGFKEVCVDVANVPTTISQVTALWNTLGYYWGAGIAHSTVVEFNGHQTGAKPGAASDNYNIPFDGSLHDVGTIQFTASPTGTARLLVHINDATKCGAAVTCFRRPATPTIPIPELSTVILTSTGLLGIVLISRKYRGR